MPKNTILAATAALVLVAGGALAQSDHGAATAPGSQEEAAGERSDMQMMDHGAGRAPNVALSAARLITAQGEA